MELREALAQIAEIRARAAAAERFRGYRAAPVAATGGLAGLAAVAQPAVAPDPAADLMAYLAVWVGAAVAGAGLAAAGVVARARAGADPLAAELTRLAVGQFAPCLAAGAVVTAAVARSAPDCGWLLPGLWQVLFALGIFASCRLLPPAVAAVGAFYLAAGAYHLTLGGPAALAPWVMGATFAAGQLATAAVLYWHLERDRDAAG